ncbi:MAG: nickel pincer cofactor biosynthesis protein LarB [Coriobacteriales bacterium]
MSCGNESNGMEREGGVGGVCAAGGQLHEQPGCGLPYAQPDLDRARRQGAGEVIYGASKSAEQIAGITRALREGGQPLVIATRVDAAKALEAQALLPAELAGECTYHEDARMLLCGPLPQLSGAGVIAVVCAGTSDIYCAEEAALTAEALGNRVTRIYDVGVAGIHRLLAREAELRQARCIVAVAGMEGALPSVIGGLVSCPVIAVPTSVGYGASFGGVTALLAMLNSCSSGVSVVNIDNGFGAGYQASLINHLP